MKNVIELMYKKSVFKKLLMKLTKKCTFLINSRLIKQIDERPKDKLFEKLNTYHDSIKLTIEKNPTKFLDREIVRHNSAITIKVYSRSKKFPVPWSSKIPLRYKCNAITGKLHRANKIASNFSNKMKRIKIKYLEAGFPIHIINDVFHRFNQQKDEVLIPQ